MNVCRFTAVLLCSFGFWIPQPTSAQDVGRFYPPTDSVQRVACDSLFPSICFAELARRMDQDRAKASGHNERGALIYAQPRLAGGTYIYIKGQIVLGDEQKFESLHPAEPVYVRPSGPGGNALAGLAIADIIWQRRYNTLLEIADGECASACTTIWLSGQHTVVEQNAILRFHSCYNANTDLDDMRCDATVAGHLINYGYTDSQASALANAAPHQTTRLGTLAWVTSLGLRWQTLPLEPGVSDRCMARLCLLVP